MRRPSIHQTAPFPQRVAAAIGLLRFIADQMRQRRLSDLASELGFVAGPIAEARAEAVHGVLGMTSPAERHGEAHVGERTASLCSRKDELTLPLAGETRRKF